MIEKMLWNQVSKARLSVPYVPVKSNVTNDLLLCFQVQVLFICHMITITGGVPPQITAKLLSENHIKQGEGLVIGGDANSRHKVLGSI